jgi:SagB-type dehydrogenase family enzyme
VSKSLELKYIKRGEKFAGGGDRKMVRYIVFGLFFILLIMSGCSESQTSLLPTDATTSTVQTVKLPDPGLTGDVSLEEALATRRSIREYSQLPLSLEELSQMLWAAQGITSDTGARTAPSAGGLYPLEVYVAVGRVNNLSPGIYRYQPKGHELISIKEGDFRGDLAGAALDQSWVKEAAIDVIISFASNRITPKYGDRGIRYAHLEAGHAAQNLCLQTTVLDLGAVTIGAFDDEKVKELLGIPKEETPLYIIPVGKKTSS